MKKTKQVSESIELGIILALSGGFMDAYSYMCRGKVFANAQTGNMLLFGVYLSKGNFFHAFQYLMPIIAFALGIALTDFIRVKQINRLHWRQILVLVEAFVLFGVSFISVDLIANSLISFACGIQVEAFRKIRNNGIATTMCIGNLRSAIQNFFDYCYEHKKNKLDSSIIYSIIIITFIIGAVIGNICVQYFDQQAIIVSSILLLAAFMMMFIDHEV